ncbi:MAG: hypothetical protein ABR604_02930 [Jatrophihabitantaceae bacterium]
MEYSDYVRQGQHAAALYDAGNHDGAGAVFEALAQDVSLPEVDRANMYRNAAICLQPAGGVERVEQLFDQAIALEQKWNRAPAREAKWTWLLSTFRRDEARELAEAILAEGWLTLDERRTWEDRRFQSRA